jgi:2-oxoglutarate ferredoxin oxidoreductase subunit beta
MSNPDQLQLPILDLPEYTKQDFTSDQTVRWCPGCGDYSILAQVQKIMPLVAKETNTPKEKIVFLSGIGCSSRFPYYMDTYGFHSIHGRAPTFATGVKVANPELMVWIVTGDGDGLSIGGNHLVHCLRRNLDIKILLFNNRIYGLTKGQYSPTSEIGKRTKSSPMGSTERPINPISVAIAAEATFIARSIDTDSKSLQEILMRVAKHKGSAFVEIYQNCNVFNDKTFTSFAERSVRDDKTVTLVHGKPVIYGKDRKKCIVVDRSGGGIKPKVANVSDVNQEDILVHDEAAESPALAYLLSQLGEPDFPVPLGIFRQVHHDTYEDLIDKQIETAIEKNGKGNMETLLNAGDTWSVKG